MSEEEPQIPMTQVPKNQAAAASESALQAEGSAPQAETTDSQTEPSAASTEQDLLEALRQVIDPELMINIVDLGLVYSVSQDDENERAVNVEMTLTSPACPAGPQIVQQAKMALERLDDVDQAKITLTMTPPWSPDRMTDEAKDQLGIF